MESIGSSSRETIEVETDSQKHSAIEPDDEDDDDRDGKKILDSSASFIARSEWHGSTALSDPADDLSHRHDWNRRTSEKKRKSEEGEKKRETKGVDEKQVTELERERLIVID